MGELGPIRKLFISDRERDIVLEAVEDRWSRDAQSAIPMEVRGVTRAYLDALKLLPDNWYQGAKVLNAIPLMKYRAWVAFFKKYAAFSSSTSKIDSAGDMVQLLKGVPRSIFRTDDGNGGKGGGGYGEEVDGGRPVGIPPSAGLGGESQPLPGVSGTQRRGFSDQDVIMRDSGRRNSSRWKRGRGNHRGINRRGRDAS